MKNDDRGLDVEAPVAPRWRYAQPFSAFAGVMSTLI